jgi:hypothetical protein
MTVSHRLPDRGIDKEGISPDVQLDIPLSHRTYRQCR